MDEFLEELGLGCASKSLSNVCMDGRMIVTSELGIGGMASGLQIQVTNTDMCRSKDVPAAMFAMSMSIGANHSMDAVTSNPQKHQATVIERIYVRITE